jgi:hypothetical protein
MLYDVLVRVSADTGLHVTQKRSVLLGILNSAADEMFKLVDPLKSHREVTLAVPNNKIVTLPDYIGELRGMKLSADSSRIDLHPINTPRYVTNLDTYKLNNWRDLGEQPVHTLPSASGKLRFLLNSISDPVVEVIVSGETAQAARDEERVSLTASGLETTKVFTPNILAIASFSSDRPCNITIQAEDGTEIAVLYNNRSKTRYKLIDVSEFAWPDSTGSDEALVDVLYTLPVSRLTKDTDSFWAGDDYDDAWYHMAMWCHLSPIQNRKQEAMVSKATALQMLNATKESSERQTEKRLTFGPNKYYNLC